MSKHEETIAALEHLARLLRNPEAGLYMYRLAINTARLNVLECLDATPNEWIKP